MIGPRELDEHELHGGYPVYAGYLYVVDGRVFRAPWDSNVHDMRRWIVANDPDKKLVASFKSCDIVGRGLERLAL